MPTKILTIRLRISRKIIDHILLSLVFTHLWHRPKFIKPVPKVCILQIRSAHLSASDPLIIADFVEIGKGKFIRVDEKKM